MLSARSLPAVYIFTAFARDNSKKHKNSGVRIRPNDSRDTSITRCLTVRSAALELLNSLASIRYPDATRIACDLAIPRARGGEITNISIGDVIELQENPAQFPIKSSLRVVFVRRNP